MGNTHFNTYNNILHSFENTSELVVLNMNKNSAKVFSKQSLSFPYKVKVIWKKKNQDIDRLAISSSIEQIIFNFKMLLIQPLSKIENLIGIGGVDTKEVRELLEQDLIRHSHFDNDGIYSVNFTFQPYLFISPNMYKILFHQQTRTHYEPLISTQSIRNIVEFEPTPQDIHEPNTDIYGKI